MSRFQCVAESVAAVAAGNTFASLQAGAAAGFKLRRVTLGVRAGAAVPTSQQLTIAMYRVTTRGITPTSTATGQKMDPASAATAITGCDIGPFGTAPVLAAAPNYEVSFNSQSGVDLPFEMLEELAVAIGTANGIGFVNVGNALPASHLYTVGLEWEE